MESKARKVKKQLDSAAVASGDDSDLDEVVDDEESDGGNFFKAKKGSTTEAAKAKVEKDDEEAGKILPSLSKKALRKIKEDGPYAGLNRIKLDGEGKVDKKTGVFDSDYMSKLRKADSKNADGTDMKIEHDLEVEVKKGGEEQDKHVKRIKDALAKTKSGDDKMRKEKLKEKRIKLKKRLRAENGISDDEGGVALESASDAGSDAEGDDSPGDDSQDARSESGSDNEASSIEDIPLKAKRQKT